VHGDRHRNLLRLSPSALAADLDRAQDTIGMDGAGLHRAPYGTYSLAALHAVRSRGWQPLLWSRWGRDWRRRATPDSVTREVTRDLSDGDVLLLHDADEYGAPESWRATVAALPGVIDAIEAVGLRASSVTAVQLEDAGR
jgi:peptidoglycan/xylan/chitin deacetylase (PgdA/CDA1 family)